MNINTCIIIDDEAYAIEGLKAYINSIPNLSVLKTYTDPLEALIDLVNSDMVDLILLDIDMPKITGIELSKEIRQKTRKLVFTTSYTQYGYLAFEAEADAYLLKPYTLTKFASTISKLFPPNEKPIVVEKVIDNYFFVKNKDEHLKIVKIKYDDVIAVESKQNYVMIHTVSKKVLTYMSLTEISKIFTRFNNFEQFQRSFIISKEHIDNIDGNTINMVNGIQITVGEYYRKDFTTFLSEKLIKARRKE
ncbi:LytR/AlgR family response regulator transcription factor [Mucilaginibacter psychrotolerans]|jgi:DNA-binding LytR/AlgR family response regulator|uniref:Response regulator transcription factor n=1 Tax=Mucilaginibacter psychrotolerans TaxID=1524096 RepID=A0A4Y8SEH3_9SPHI|nr:LytTR family DNA-binding domain-containing protein [Mucilaginibacter psychrotolerans]TFF37030.1 response regulator transcription factor [Mucilaginibacter psychrotolerans]